MGFEQYPNNYEQLLDQQEVPGITAAARDLLKGAFVFLKNVLQEISLADLSQKEPSQCKSQTTPEHLPQAPDFTPIHDDTL